MRAVFWHLLPHALHCTSCEVQNQDKPRGALQQLALADTMLRLHARVVGGPTHLGCCIRDGVARHRKAWQAIRGARLLRLLRPCKLEQAWALPAEGASLLTAWSNCPNEQSAQTIALLSGGVHSSRATPLAVPRTLISFCPAAVTFECAITPPSDPAGASDCTACPAETRKVL
jgi:hypothetical protein